MFRRCFATDQAFLLYPDNQSTYHRNLSVWMQLHAEFLMKIFAFRGKENAFTQQEKHTYDKFFRK